MKKKPENVVLLLCDGLGSRIMDNILDKNEFLIKKREKEFFCVYPPTTAACLNSIKTGLNPSEHGWVGWSCYVKPINKIIKLYKDIEKGKNEKDKDFLEIKDKYFKTRPINDSINEAGKYLAYETTCYPYNNDKDIDRVFNKVLEKLKIKGKKLFLLIILNPIVFLHDFGVTSDQKKKKSKKLIKKWKNILN